MLQECFLDFNELQDIQLMNYRTVARSKPIKVKMKSKEINRRGSVILAHETLNVQTLKDRSKNQIELIGIRAVGESGRPAYKNPFEIWTIYCPPQSEIQEPCSLMIEELCKERGRVLLAGDFNSNINPAAHLKRPRIRKKLELLQKEGLLTILNDYNLITTKRGTTIDLAVTMGNWEKGFVFPIEWDLNSTHFLICIGLVLGNYEKKNKEYTRTPKYIRTKEVKEKVNKDLKDLMGTAQSLTGNQLAKAVLDSFTKNAEDTSPRKKRRRQRHWWNDKIKNLFIKKQEYLAKILKNNKARALVKVADKKTVKASAAFPGNTPGMPAAASGNTPSLLAVASGNTPSLLAVSGNTPSMPTALSGNIPNLPAVLSGNTLGMPFAFSDNTPGLPDAASGNTPGLLTVSGNYGEEGSDEEDPPESPNGEPLMEPLSNSQTINYTKEDEEFKRIKMELQEEIDKEKNKTFQEFASNLDHRNNNSTIYKAIKNLSSQRESKIAELTLITRDEQTISNNKEKARILAKSYQVPLGNHLKRQPKRKQMLDKNRKLKEREFPRGTNHTSFTEAEARFARREMSNNKAPGLSGLKKEDLEMGGRELDSLVAQLANKMSVSGKWPQIFKSGLACPLPKNTESRDTFKEDETRPITLSEVLDKWIQKMLYNRIKPYVQFHETQAGYVLSCEHHTSLVRFFEK